MKQSKTDTFVHELPLQLTPHDLAKMDVRLEMTRQLYNACLREALRRMDLMRESKGYQAARKLPKTVSNKPNPERRSAFKDCREKYDVSAYSLHAFAASTRKACAIKDHLDVNTCQTIATRAFKAVTDYCVGRHGRPRFKRTGWLSSIEGKTNKQGIIWRDGLVKWSGLSLHPLFDQKDKYGIGAHALASQIKYLRLVKRSFKGEARWFVQLVLTGQPLAKEKNKATTNTVGLDIGPSTIAVVGDNEALLQQFCSGVVNPRKEIRRVDRAIDRSRRACNPDNYNADGTAKKGRRAWVKSTRYKKLQIRKADLLRAMAATRKKEHGELTNAIIRLGSDIRTERLSYKSFQKNFGRSVRDRAPGMFVSLLRRKAGNAGGGVVDISTRMTRLSQTCLCGSIEKKPLKQRHHICACGVTAQRDLFSAFLASHCTTETLDMRRANEAWPAAEPLLRRAMSRLTQTANGRMYPSSFGLSRRQSGLPVKDGSPLVEAVDAVVAGNNHESHGETQTLAVRTPWF